MNFKKLCVFDFETDSPDPYECNPVQIAAIVIDPRKLTYIKNAEFNSMMRPPGIREEEYFTDKRVETIKWHAKIRKTSYDDIVKTWKEAPDREFVWKRFVEFVKKFNPKDTVFTAPIPCGANIKDFDLIIADRLNEQYGVSTLFYNSTYIDVQQMAFQWFENLPKGKCPINYKMDTIRDFLGMSDDGAHDAIVDVRDTAAIMIRFMKLYRKIAKTVKFKGSFGT